MRDEVREKRDGERGTCHHLQMTVSRKGNGCYILKRIKQRLLRRRRKDSLQISVRNYRSTC